MKALWFIAVWVALEVITLAAWNLLLTYNRRHYKP